MSVLSLTRITPSLTEGGGTLYFVEEDVLIVYMHDPIFQITLPPALCASHLIYNTKELELRTHPETRDNRRVSYLVKLSQNQMLRVHILTTL